MTFIEGTVLDIIFRNNENSYTVLELDCDGVLNVCVGNIPFIQPGEYVRFYGAHTTHKTFGDQFKVTGMESRMPEGDESIRLFLSGGLIKGVGEVLAERIVDRFHERTFEVIENNPHELALVKGISMSAAMKISEQLTELKAVRGVIMELQDMGLSIKQSFAAYEAYGVAAPETIRSNPYKLIDDVFGIGFERADAIAERLGIDKDSDIRVYNGIRYILKKQMDEQGHTCLPRERLKKLSMETLGADENGIEDALSELVLNGALCESEYNGARAMATSGAHRAEAYCAYRLNAMRGEKPATEVNQRIVDKVLSGATMLSKAQELAIQTALSGCISVITGGPGTGKTTILNEIISITEQSGMVTLLAAPTGRAAKRMEKATLRKAHTIHRLLEYSLLEEDDKERSFRFNRDEENPLEADAVIIDETSMVDIFLMHSLLKAIAPGTRLILTGDADQLPSVGPGNVLRDIIDSGLIPVFRLTEVYRQKGNIAYNAHRVNNGEPPELFEAGDFMFIRAKGQDATLDAVKKLYFRSASEGTPLDELQVICPIKRGAIGVYRLNTELREIANPKDTDKGELLFGETVFRVGDKVMQTVNDYQKEWRYSDAAGMGRGAGVFNGDMGVIEDIDEQTGELTILFDGDRLADYQRIELANIEHAYAITVHKSQGSEFDTVILPLNYGSSPFLSRNLLYTAMTRAKNKLIIVGTEQTIEFMTGNNRISHRFTALNYEMLDMDGSLISEEEYDPFS